MSAMETAFIGWENCKTVASSLNKLALINPMKFSYGLLFLNKMSFDKSDIFEFMCFIVAAKSDESKFGYIDLSLKELPKLNLTLSSSGKANNTPTFIASLNKGECLYCKMLYVNGAFILMLDNVTSVQNYLNFS